MYGTRTSLRSIMVDHGDGALKIWATEYGAPTYGPPGSFVSVTTQAAMVKRAYELWSGYPWAGPLFMYSGRDAGNDATTNQDWFGLLNFIWGVKPSYDVYWDLTHTLAAIVQADRRSARRR
jgi:polysaccharide biosynthesis protein PslG